MELSEADAELYQKAQILSSIQKLYQDYQVLYAMEEYDMALDSLIRSVGRCANYEEQASALQLTDAIAALRDKSAIELQNLFGVSAEQAMEIYNLRDRKEYSTRIQDIIRQLGLQKAEEE